MAAPDLLNLVLGAGDDTARAYVQPDDASITTAVLLQLQGGLGDDRLEIVGASADPATLLGGQGDDTLISGDGDDLILGGAGSDSISGGSGADLLQGDSDASGVGTSPTLIAAFAMLASDPAGGGPTRSTVAPAMTPSTAGPAMTPSSAATATISSESWAPTPSRATM